MTDQQTIDEPDTSYTPPPPARYATTTRTAGYITVRATTRPPVLCEVTS